VTGKKKVASMVQGGKSERRRGATDTKFVFLNTSGERKGKKKKKKWRTRLGGHDTLRKEKRIGPRTPRKKKKKLLQKKERGGVLQEEGGNAAINKNMFETPVLPLKKKACRKEGRKRALTKRGKKEKTDTCRL